MPTQCMLTCTKPKAFRNFPNFLAFSTFMKMSATWSDIGTYSSWSVLSSIFSQIQWWRALMCLDHAWKIGFSTKAIVDWLSMSRGIGNKINIPISPKVCFRNATSFPAWVMAMYSALVLESANIVCFFADQATMAPHRINMYLDMDLWEFGSPAQLESE